MIHTVSSCCNGDLCVFCDVETDLLSTLRSVSLGKMLNDVVWFCVYRPTRSHETCVVVCCSVL